MGLRGLLQGQLYLYTFTGHDLCFTSTRTSYTENVPEQCYDIAVQLFCIPGCVWTMAGGHVEHEK
jgi:hypothetical protein